MEITPQYVNVNMPSNLRPVHPRSRIVACQGVGFISLTKRRYVA